MITYSEFKPTEFDIAGLGLEDRQDWLVTPFSQTRDSDCLTRSNFESATSILEEEHSSDDWEIHRFGHWGPGWFEIIIVKPNSSAHKAMQEAANAYADYPVLDEEHFSMLEHEEAAETWKNSYNYKDRIKYIRENRSQFDFHSMTELMSCVRGEVFLGYAGELLQ